MKKLKRWQQIQQQEYEYSQQKYRQTGSYFGYFSVPEFYVTSQIAEIIEQVDGPILDIGCGLLPMPNYLKDCQQPFGVDPYFGSARQFPTAQAIGEQLPFKSNHFAAVLLMSVIDHLIDPARVAKEITRILKDNGLLFIWYISRSKTDKHHLWAFDRARLLGLFNDFFEIEFYTFPGDKKVGFPKTEMMVMKL